MRELGSEVNAWLDGIEFSENEQLLSVCVLRGGAFFFADLLRELCLSVEPFFCRARSYSSETNTQSSGVNIEIESVDLSGRVVLIVDDICDSGRTLAAITESFKERGAKDVRSVSLLYRASEQSVFKPDWHGFEYVGDEWFVGYGMEDKNTHSNLPGVYLIN